MVGAKTICTLRQLPAPASNNAGRHPWGTNIMTVVRSLVLGKARKSAGNVTFRNVRGRVIMSEKVGERPITRAPGEPMNVYHFMFTLISRFMNAHKHDIAVSFDKTKYGSARNAFFKQNYAALTSAFQPLYNDTPETDKITDEKMEQAVTTYATENPNSIYRVKRSGFPVKYLSGAWSTTDNPEEPITAPATISRIEINGEEVETASASKFTSGATLSIIGKNMQVSTLTAFIGAESEESPADNAKPLSELLTVQTATTTLISGTLKSAHTSAEVMKVYENGARLVTSKNIKDLSLG